MRKRIQNICGIWVIGLLLLLVGCNKTPQPVRHLGNDTQPDSLLMAQLAFNQQMINHADIQCLKYIQNDTLHTYAQDEFGFWYTILQHTTLDSLQTGQQLDMHIQIFELNDSLIADIKENLQIGDGELPLAINRALHNRRLGEQIQIIAPWYTAYGVEGTSLIKPYSNLRIVVGVES